MAKTNTQEQDELEQIRNRLDWMDEERLKGARRLVQLEQQMTARERELEGRDLRLKELEGKLASMTVQVARVSNVDNQLGFLKDELVKLIEQYDQRRIDGYQELDNLRRIEHEVQQRELAAIRKELTPISRLENEMKLRESEDVRLTKIAGKLQNKIPSLSNEIENWKQELKFVEESERTNAAALAQIQTSQLERVKQVEAIETRLDIVNHGLSKVQVSTQKTADLAAELSLKIKESFDQVQVGEHRRNQQLDEWQRVLDEHKADMDRYASEWVKYSDQYKEAKMAIQTMTEWQERLELQQREAAELARVEANQLRSKWDKFMLENDKRWKNNEVDQEQRWSGAQRRETKVQERIRDLTELVEAIQQDKDTLWRVQNAQAEAMKKWPRIWLEEVEKARTHNPNSRRQPTLVPVREE